MRILITGGAGFVGHHFVEHFLKNTDAEIVVLDKLTYASNGFSRLRDIEAFDDKRVLSIAGDFTQEIPEGVRQEIGNVDYIFHLGAESHVDNSISNPEPFVRSNVLGTMHMLNYARTVPNLKMFYYFSTDEVFGAAPAGVSYKEDDRHSPTNPYSAAKSGGEMLVKAYNNTYGLPTIITRSMNIGGQRQHKEKFIPMCIRKIYNGETITIHSNPDKTKAGSRFYIHGRNVADGYLFLIDLMENKNMNLSGQDFHITGSEEIDNLDLANRIARFVGKPLKYELVDFHSSRPGHDLRYALDGGKMKKLGWEPPHTVNRWLKETVEWSLKDSNRHWVGL